MKASVITMTKTYNYGATLQAYALQEYVRSMGHECDIVDHMGYDGHRILRVTDLSFDTLVKLPYKRELERGYRCFEQFYDEHMRMTRRYNEKEALVADPPVSDVYISGSDQVWNPRDLRGEFYLDFAPTGKKRVSYAASLGVSRIPEEQRAEVRELLRSIDAISVREKAGVEAISELTDTPVNLNCDPVFLLDRQRWIDLESPVDGLEEGFILCYMIYKPEWLNDWLKAVRKRTGKKIVIVGLQGYRSVTHDRYVRSAGPREFLWLIHHASAVVTSSFHGAAFSILMRKPFVAMPDPPRPARLHNLLGLFGLEDRILYECNKDYEFLPCDEAAVANVIAAEQAKTDTYFKGIFES